MIRHNLDSIPPIPITSDIWTVTTLLNLDEPRRHCEAVVFRALVWYHRGTLEMLSELLELTRGLWIICQSNHQAESNEDWENFLEVLDPIVLQVQKRVWQRVHYLMDWSKITPTDFEALHRYCPKELSKVNTKRVQGCSKCAQTQYEERRDALVN